MKEFIVKVPVKIAAESEEDALNAAEKQYGKRPKKAELDEVSLWPEALRPLVNKYGVKALGSTVIWGEIDGDTWGGSSYFVTRLPGVVFDGLPYAHIGSVPRRPGKPVANRLAFRLHYQIGSACISREIVDFVEELHGECEWRAGEDLDPVAGYKGDKWVATVMPRRGNPTLEDARIRITKAQCDKTRAEDTMREANAIRKAAADLPAAQARREQAVRESNAAAMEVIQLEALASQASALATAEATIAKATAEIEAMQSELEAMGQKPSEQE